MNRCRTCNKTEEDGVKFYLNSRSQKYERECNICKSERGSLNNKIRRENPQQLSTDDMNFIIENLKWLAKYWGEDPKSKSYDPEYHNMIKKLEALKTKGAKISDQRAIQEVC
jgi:hypothetical protein